MIDKQVSDCFLKSQQLRITKKSSKVIVQVNIFFFLLILIILLYCEKYVACILYGIVLIPTTIYLYYQMQKRWNFLTGTIALMLNCFLLLFTIYMAFYGMGLLLDVFNGPVFFSSIIFVATLLICTYFYRYQRIAKKKYQEKRNNSIVGLLPGTISCCTLFFISNYVIKSSVMIQAIVFSSVFVLCLCMLVVFLGWTAIPMYYLCSKFGIPEECKNQSEGTTT